MSWSLERFGAPGSRVELTVKAGEWGAPVRQDQSTLVSVSGNPVVTKSPRQPRTPRIPELFIDNEYDLERLESMALSSAVLLLTDLDGKTYKVKIVNNFDPIRRNTRKKMWRLQLEFQGVR